MIFPRDLSYAGLLGLNALYPVQMYQSLCVVQSQRDAIAWDCPRGHVLRGFDHIPINEVDLDPTEYIRHHRTSGPIGKTDTVAWLWAAGDLFERWQAEPELWRWLLMVGTNHFNKWFDPFFDEGDGLYWGQVSFVDVGHDGYPPSFGRQGTPRTTSEQAEAARNNGVRIKAPCTNSLYVQAMRVMAVAASHCQDASTQTYWQQRASDLAASIRINFLTESGHFAYFKHPDGQLEPRRGAMGSALPVLAGVVSGEVAQKVLADYPQAEIGVPTFYPFYETSESYHNRSTWPFASGLFYTALERAHGRSMSAEHLLALDHAYDDQGFRELINWESKKPQGQAGQLWSCAAFVGACIRSGFLKVPHSQFGIDHPLIA